MRKWMSVSIIAVFLIALVLSTTKFNIESDFIQNTESVEYTDWEKVYDAVEDTISNKRTTIFIVADISKDDIVNIFKAVTLDHPEFMTIKKEFTIMSIGQFKKITFSYAKFNEERAFQVVDEIAERMNSMTDYEKVSYIYQLLTENVEYSTDEFRYSSAYGPLVDLKGTCEGYSEAMSLLLTAVGVDNALISGKVDGVPHRWVRAEINNVWYEFDPTFDAGKNTWNYFMVDRAH